MSTKYNVTAAIQSPGNDPVEVRYATETNEIGVAHAVASILATPIGAPDVPEAFRAVLLGIDVKVVA